MLRRLTVPDLSAQGLPAPAGGFTQFVRSGTVPILDHGFVDAVKRGQIRMHQAPGLYFVGISVVLSGQLWPIGREAQAVARHVATAG